MDPILIFYGLWTIKVKELILGAGAPAVQLILDRTTAADGICACRSPIQPGGR